MSPWSSQPWVLVLCQRRLCGLLHCQMQACLHMLIRSDILLTLNLSPPVPMHT